MDTDLSHEFVLDKHAWRLGHIAFWTFRQVALTQLVTEFSTVEVSTVEIRRDGTSDEAIFQTAVFGGPLHDEDEMEDTHQAAMNCHNGIVSRIGMILTKSGMPVFEVKLIYSDQGAQPIQDL